jgi:hypothetical protein
MFPLLSFINPPGTVVFDVWVSDPALTADLAAFLAGTVYEPVRIAGSIVSVRKPVGLGDDVARLELDIYLRLWSRDHLGETAEVVPAS